MSCRWVLKYCSSTWVRIEGFWLSIILEFNAFLANQKTAKLCRWALWPYFLPPQSKKHSNGAKDWLNLNPYKTFKWRNGTRSLMTSYIGCSQTRLNWIIWMLTQAQNIVHSSSYHNPIIRADPIETPCGKRRGLGLSAESSVELEWIK